MHEHEERSKTHEDLLNLLALEVLLGVLGLQAVVDDELVARLPPLRRRHLLAVGELQRVDAAQDLAELAPGRGLCAREEEGGERREEESAGGFSVATTSRLVEKLRDETYRVLEREADALGRVDDEDGADREGDALVVEVGQVLPARAQ